MPEILALIDEFIDDLEEIPTNTPPHAVIRINGVDPGDFYAGQVNVPITFDGLASWDEGGEIVSWEWDSCGDKRTGDTISYTWTMITTCRVILTVKDNGSPQESATDWVDVNINLKVFYKKLNFLYFFFLPNHRSHPLKLG